MELTAQLVITAVLTVITGAFTIYNHYTRTKKEVAKDAEEEEDKVVTIYKDVNTALEKRVADLERKVNEMAVELTRDRNEKEALVADKAALTAVLQGRDQASGEMMKQSMQAVQNINDISPLVKEMAETIKELDPIIRDIYVQSMKITPV